jgi:hypothetical protein
MKRWLWPINIVISGLLVLLLVPAPLVSYKISMSSCTDEMMCDFHGYIMLFSYFATFVLAVFTITAFGLTAARLRGGMVMGVINALVILWIVISLLADGPLLLLVPAGVLAAVSLGFCIAGLIAAPGRERIVSAPWPQHPES